MYNPPKTFHGTRFYLAMCLEEEEEEENENLGEKIKIKRERDEMK